MPTIKNIFGFMAKVVAA